MSLRFLGDWNPWVGGAVALALAIFAWMLYRRETRVHASRLSWLLPLARTIVVFMAVLMLTGPVLHHRKVMGERGRVLLFVDGSKSMTLTDDSMEPARKLLALQRLGWLPAEALDTTLSEAADALGRARRAAEAGGRDATARFTDGVKETAALLGKVKAETGGVMLEEKGVLLREVWMNVPGTDVADLTRHPSFLGRPTQVARLQMFEAPGPYGNNYGMRISGFITPPADGTYTFWIAGDDKAELWLSPDADPAHKAIIARAFTWTPPNGWDTSPEQKSAPLRLKAGEKVYIEALHKQATGADHVSVGWQLPGGTMERPIPGTRLSTARTAGEPPVKSLESMVARFREELLDPAQALASGKKEKDAALNSLASVAARWERELRQGFASHAGRVAASPGEAVKAALKKFDALPRHKRVEALLTSGSKSLLEQLAEKHRVEIMSLAGKEATTVWTSGREDAGPGIPRVLKLDPQSRSTNLNDGIRARVGDRDEERVAAVLFSDGQHNDGPSPLQTARVLGNRRIPIYAVSVGSAALPDDLAVLRVKAPSSVFFKDRVKGEIVLKDDMPPGKPFTISVQAGGATLWEKKLTTEQSHNRTIPFDFPIQALVEKIAAQREKGVEVLNQPLAFTAVVSPVEGEKEKTNNESDFNLHAIMQRRKVLILDGRARWETRYLRNLFERDEQWEANGLLADKGGDAPAWPRGPGAGKFPADREGLFAYDLIVFGEVPRQCLTMAELEWIRDFVGRRGGGLLVIDGRRGHVAGYAESPIGALLPVDWKGEAGRPTGLRLTEKGGRFAPLALAQEADRNAEIWGSLAPPHWVAPARALPGSETLLEAAIGERRVPALVARRFGAGKVLYAGFDETWRWRYEVADLHHQRYWNQIVHEVMEPPFAVRDARVALDAGKPVYATGDFATIRARIRDAQGRPIDQADAEAWVYRDGRKVASIKLAPDENLGGTFHGATSSLAPGRYEVRLHAAGLPDGDPKVKTEFVVRSADAGELALLNANEDLMRQMASLSGGEFFREEEVADLVSRLEPLSREKVIESDTALWQSWWWFVPILGLLTIEWVLRKWAGML